MQGNLRLGGECILENYAKVILYAYPLLKTVGEDYAVHIRNKAVLSYESNLSTEQLAEYLAGEIIEKNRLEWLKDTLENLFSRLTEEERTLLDIRYFGKTKQLRNFLKMQDEKRKSGGTGCSERMYFRRQSRLADKIGAMLFYAGITKKLYDEKLKDLEIFRTIDRFVEAGRDKKISADERRFLGGDGG